MWWEECDSATMNLSGGNNNTVLRGVAFEAQIVSTGQDSLSRTSSSRIRRYCSGYISLTNCFRQKISPWKLFR